ncbi:hypothetical protein EAO70_03065 [Streptomyces sp. adm13(2018)]|uniref:hypothetical protein n=1 Tax=Streptomyces sp. adm13(2018) TaxID=2479007 RepID=UPI0011CD5401|nr:hypothetical protein [Streptomyces sp. adm13(2018)]TXS26383.1 hypothetical protein EAO70_03065 [Streptomyces sp. adm13(2018)]
MFRIARHSSPTFRRTPPRRLLAATAALLLLSVTGAALPHSVAAATEPSDGGSTAVAPASPQVPAGVTAGVAVFDRQTGTFTEQLAPAATFRSASVVKLLIALDFLWNRSPDTLPAADRTRLDAMLRSSQDAAASHYWSAYGGSAIVGRMVTRLGLTDTAPPPAGYEGYWGYTAMSARDTVKTYRYILESAPAPVRSFVMDRLRQSTRCASDSFDQHFGIAGAFDRPWAVKQGWSGRYAQGNCGPAGAAAARGTDVPGPASPATGGASVDLSRPALHTTGTVGAGDRSIVAVLTLHPDGTSYGKAYTDLGRLTRSLNVPGGTAPKGKWYGTWGQDVAVRAAPVVGDNLLTRLPAGVEVLVGCQKKGQQVSVPPYTNDWWAYLPQYGGYVTNIYLSHPDNQLPDVPLCTNPK